MCAKVDWNLVIFSDFLGRDLVPHTHIKYANIAKYENLKLIEIWWYYAHFFRNIKPIVAMKSILLYDKYFSSYR